MTGICLPIDASSGSPSFPAAQNRVAFGALMSPNSARPLGARSGCRLAASPAVSIAGTTWTVTPFTAVVDPGTALTVGAYLVAFEANETGVINAADSTHARLDRLDLQVPDDPPGASPRSAAIVYTAGVASSSPALPAAPARSMPIATITVPASGTAASIAATFPYSPAAGAPIPVRSKAERDALTQYAGMAVLRLDTGTIEVSNGTSFAGGAFTPTWTAANSAPTIGNGTLTGTEQVTGRKCDFTINLVLGSTTGGGTGGWAFSLPIAALAGLEQVVTAYVVAADGRTYQGVGIIHAGGTTVTPNITASLTAGNVAPAQGASAGGAAGTGIPLIASNFSYSAGDLLVISGSYWIE